MPRSEPLKDMTKLILKGFKEVPIRMKYNIVGAMVIQYHGRGLSKKQISDAVGSRLARLVKQGVLKRPKRGIYELVVKE